MSASPIPGFKALASEAPAFRSARALCSSFIITCMRLPVVPRGRIWAYCSAPAGLVSAVHSTPAASAVTARARVCVSPAHCCLCWTTHPFFDVCVLGSVCACMLTHTRTSAYPNPGSMSHLFGVTGAITCVPTPRAPARAVNLDVSLCVCGATEPVAASPTSSHSSPSRSGFASTRCAPDAMPPSPLRRRVCS